MFVKIGKQGLYGITDVQELKYVLEILGYGRSVCIRPGVYRVEQAGTPVSAIKVIGKSMPWSFHFA